jgi:hypothetical protein
MISECQLMEILIGTPVADQSVTVSYLQSIRRLEQQFSGKASFDFAFPQSAMMMFSRNVIANIALRNERLSHLLFIDYDIAFTPSLIEEMIAFDKPIVAALRRTPTFLAHRHPETRAMEPSESGLVKLTDDSMPVWRGNFVKVTYADTALMLIKRRTLLAMGERFPELWTIEFEDPYRAFGLSGKIFQCFAPIKNHENLFCTEDLSFCLRWSQGCRGEIWLYENEAI